MSNEPNTERKEKVVKLRKEGFTFEEIGKMFEITRQRAHQIYTEAIRK